MPLSFLKCVAIWRASQKTSAQVMAGSPDAAWTFQCGPQRAASRYLAHDAPLAIIRERSRMFQIHREEIDWAGRKLVFETGKVARQADGAVMASWGETTVLATVVSAKAAKPGQDFFP